MILLVEPSKDVVATSCARERFMVYGCDVNTLRS
jgi:hypothetical protein